MNSSDYTVLRNGSEIGNAAAEWDQVGTDDEGQHLHLADYLVRLIPGAHFDVWHFVSIRSQESDAPRN